MRLQAKKGEFLSSCQSPTLTRPVRKNLYKSGGLISVTSRILVVDMLQSDIPIELITGMLIMHAEQWVLTLSALHMTLTARRVTPLVLEAFIVRLYREKNKMGFVKEIGRAHV